MDITGFDIGATLTAVGALVKAFHYGREVKKLKKTSLSVLSVLKNG